MSQKFLHVMAPSDRERVLTQRLEAAGFRVHRSQRMSGGVEVRVRDTPEDRAEVEAIVRNVAPGASYGPEGAPTADIVDYRKGR